MLLLQIILDWINEYCLKKDYDVLWLVDKCMGCFLDYVLVLVVVLIDCVEVFVVLCIFVGCLVGDDDLKVIVNFLFVLFVDVVMSEVEWLNILVIEYCQNNLDLVVFFSVLLDYYILVWGVEWDMDFFVIGKWYN